MTSQSAELYPTGAATTKPASAQAAAAMMEMAGLTSVSHFAATSYRHTHTSHIHFTHQLALSALLRETVLALCSLVSGNRVSISQLVWQALAHR